MRSKTKRLKIAKKGNEYLSKKSFKHKYKRGVFNSKPPMRLLLLLILCYLLGRKFHIMCDKKDAIFYLKITLLPRCFHRPSDHSYYHIHSDLFLCLLTT